MIRRVTIALSLAIGIAVLLSCQPWQAHAQAPPAMQWIWFDEGNPLENAPAEARYFRRVFNLDRPNAGAIGSAALEITADNRFIVWINGDRIGQGDSWERLHRFDVLKHLRNGRNVIAVQAINDGGPAGLVVRLRWTPAGKRRQEIVSDGSWRTVKAASPGWHKIDYEDAKWTKARVLGPYGRVGPWGAGGGGGRRGPVRFTPAEGFKVEPAVKDPGDRGPFSLVNMTFDARGRLLVSQEGGPILLCTKPDDKGVLQEVHEYCTQVTNCQGMCWVNDSLYLVGNGPKGTGLYRCRDMKKKDVIDEATLIHRFDGGMGEHGPHAVIHGPDNKLYVVIGNHAHARIGPKQAPNPEKLAPNSPLQRWPTGGQGPDHGQPGSTEDVLLPRLNDANGHAANLRAPGGTIWRMDLDGKNMALVAAGFRNAFDAAFSPTGELFSFDSDMEWDGGLPWYRPVRIVHCPPGAELGWRTGASKIPPYAIDTLPPIYDTGRGSPVGLTFCNNPSFGKKYQGALFMADWSIGVIYAVQLYRRGATYKAMPERFMVGTPANVTDLEFGPDGNLYFTMGGRASHGSVYRIVPIPGPPNLGDLIGGNNPPHINAAMSLIKGKEQFSAWRRAEIKRVLSKSGKWTDGVIPGEWVKTAMLQMAQSNHVPWDERIGALMALQLAEFPAPTSVLAELANNWDADIRATAIWLLGVNASPKGKVALLRALADKDALIRRVACEALIRAGIEPDVKALWPLLADDDRFVRTAARLVLQQIDPKKWVVQLATLKDLPAWEGIIALCKTGRAAEYADTIFERLRMSEPKDAQALLAWLRTLQLACFHVPDAGRLRSRLATLKEIAASCDRLFPQDDKLVNRELAILLTHFRRTGVLTSAVGAKLLAAIGASKADRQQQIHYFYCLRLLHDGWTNEQKAALARWYESTRTWSGGASYSGFLGNIFRDCLSAYDLADRKALLEQGESMPQACLILAQSLQYDRQVELLPSLRALSLKVATKTLPRAAELRRQLEDAIVRTVCEYPRAEDFPDLLRALSSSSKLVVFDALVGLKRIATKPKPDDARTYRAVLEATRKLDPGNRWKAIELLRYWTNNKQFGAEPGQWQLELQAWSKWYVQSFPKEPALPDVKGDKPTPSKYKYDDLLDYLTKGEGRKGDVKKGRVVFEKALCVKCHKYGKEGEGIGPDLTTLVKRFKRNDVLESIYYPSKVISDQYRSTMIVTRKGQRVEGLAAVQGDTITVLQNDGSKVTLRKKEIEQQFASLVSVMPEKLLDALSKREIANLFAFLESEPEK